MPQGPREEPEGPRRTKKGYFPQTGRREFEKIQGRVRRKARRTRDESGRTREEPEGKPEGPRSDKRARGAL